MFKLEPLHGSWETEKENEIIFGKQGFFGGNLFVGAPEDNDLTEARGRNGSSKSNNHRL